MARGIPPAALILGLMERDQDAGEIADQELTDVLAAYGEELEEQSRVLIATGSASITRPWVILRARLQVPRRWRRGRLEIAAHDPASGTVMGASSITLGRQAPRSASLIRGITIQLGMELAHGDFSAGPR
jgi:hypothetical protein